MAATRSRWLKGMCAAGALCLVIYVSIGYAQEPSRSSKTQPLIVAPQALRAAPSQKLAPATPIASPETKTMGCVVLGDGRVFQGEVVELAAAYHVRTKNAAVVLPFAQVRTVAPTLPEAYEQLRASYSQPTANDHLDLGRWCEQNKLFWEASTEAQSALSLEPNRKDALSLLKRAETAMGNTALPETPVNEPLVPRPVLGVAVVSSETQVEFSRRILPLVLNKCGNGACHGTSALSSFKLKQGVRPDQNLQSVLKYVDSENPESSPLLVRARTADGPHTGLFQGARGSEQYTRLMAWVLQAAQDQNQLTGVRKRPKERREGGPRYTIRPRTAEPEDTASEEQAELPDSLAAELESAPEIETVGAEEPVPAPRSPRVAPLKSEAVRKLLLAQEPDAFDPEEFNRLVHGNEKP